MVKARVNGLKSCVIILRILRDMCNRHPIWEPLKGWPLELICEKAIATCNRPLGAGEALRRVMECLASGILLPGRDTVSDLAEPSYRETAPERGWNVNGDNCVEADTRADRSEGAVLSMSHTRHHEYLTRSPSLMDLI
ncbi:hypothetical protein XENORESO_006012 [Xenotaenia resolanae]|uniref:DZF domain-containing protein n=1 Tax=Xenotaenia resolanae TaxID=208358 RepID=A0ABV0WIV7_9TELE